METIGIVNDIVDEIVTCGRTRLRNLPTFKFGNLDLDLADDYIYLGICFNWNGSFVKAKKNSFMIKHRRPCTH